MICPKTRQKRTNGDTMRAVIYARVSTKDQTNETQIEKCKNYLEMNNTKPIEIYQDTISGMKSTRPDLDRMMQHMREGYFDTIIVYKVDRMGRSLEHLIHILEELKNRHVRLISITQGIDTETTTGKLFYGIVSAFSEFERELISERTQERINRLKAEGKKLGRKPKIDPNTQIGKANITRVNNLLNENPGISIRKISQITGLSRTTVHRIKRMGVIKCN